MSDDTSAHVNRPWELISCEEPERQIYWLRIASEDGSARGLRLEGPVAAIIYIKWKHLLDAHGEADARIYLAGAIDALRYEHAIREQQILAEARELRARRTRLQEGSTDAGIPLPPPPPPPADA